jgi:hypothetical protein
MAFRGEGLTNVDATDLPEIFVLVATPVQRRAEPH